MSSTQFNSTSFFLSQWAEEKPNPNFRNLRRIELDIVQDPSVREVCSGSNCSLFHDDEKSNYITMGECNRSTLCTESRILKDGLYLASGNVSETINCVNYESQLRDW